MRPSRVICSLPLLLASICACSKSSQIPQQTKPNSGSAGSTALMGQRIKIEEKVNKMFAEQFGAGKVKIGPETRLIEDFQADELDLVEMILRVEEGFDITIDDVDASKLKRVGDFYDYVEKRLSEKRKPGSG